MIIKQNYKEVIFYALFAIISTLMLVRVFYGIEITDEAYYLAEGRTVLEGNIPYALNNSRTVGMTVLMMPFVWFFRSISPDYTGYFLYMRICFVIFKCILVLIIYYLLKKKIGVFYSACIALLMNSYHLYSIQNFSYNTISSLLVFLIGIILFLLCERDIRFTYKWIGFFLAGFLSAIAVFAHPAHALSVMIFLILLIIFRTKIRFILLYLLGGLFQVISFFTSILIQCGQKKLLQGLAWYIKSMGGLERPSEKAVIRLIWNDLSYIWIIIAINFVEIFLLGSVIDNIMCKRDFSLLDKKQSIRTSILAALLYSVIIGPIYALLCIDMQETIQYIGLGGICGAIGCFVVFILIFTFATEKALWFVGFPSFCFCLFEAFMTTGNNPSSRFLHVIPSLAVLYIIAGKNILNYDYIKSTNNSLIIGFIRNKALPILATFVIIFCNLIDLRQVFRDDDLNELTYRVNQGVFKGIYTSERNAKDTVALEKYIKNITAENDYIAFRDNVPVGYLFMNGHICDIRTWDCMQYSYGSNDPSALYAYYERIGRIPDKIIYVDYGRDKKLSIDNSDFSYNDFVNSNYKLEADIQLNNTYKRVMLFRRKNDTL